MDYKDCYKIFRKVVNYTICNRNRTFATINAVEFIIKNKIDGDLIECGVYKGGQIMAMILTLNQLNEERNIYLYDTFDGMPRPEDWEKRLIKNSPKAIEKFNRYKIDNHRSSWCKASIEEVEKNISTIKYNSNKVHFIKGMVEDTLPKSNHEKIALLRLDTDFYFSTKIELEMLYPLLDRKGILIVDDYGHWSGAKKAVDEYIFDNKLVVNIKADDGTGVTITRLE